MQMDQDSRAAQLGVEFALCRKTDGPSTKVKELAPRY